MFLDGSLYVSPPPSIRSSPTRMAMASPTSEWNGFKGRRLTGYANDLHGPYPGLDG